MRESSLVCPLHSGVGAKVEILEKDNGEQWTAINDLRKTSDRLMQKLNVVLTSLVASSVMLTINVIILLFKK